MSIDPMMLEDAVTRKRRLEEVSGIRQAAEREAEETPARLLAQASA